MAWMRRQPISELVHRRCPRPTAPGFSHPIYIRDVECSGGFVEVWLGEPLRDVEAPVDDLRVDERPARRVGPCRPPPRAGAVVDRPASDAGTRRQAGISPPVLGWRPLLGLG